MSDRNDRQPPSKLKACIVWVLMRLWHKRPRLADVLSRIVTWLWPGFQKK